MLQILSLLSNCHLSNVCTLETLRAIVTRVIALIMPSFNPVKTIMKSSGKKSKHGSLSSTDSDLSSMKSSTRSKPSSFGSKVKNRFRKNDGRKNSLPMPTESFSSFELDKLELLQGEIQELRKELQEKEKNLTKRDSMMVELISKKSSEEKLPSTSEESDDLDRDAKTSQERNEGKSTVSVKKSKSRRNQQLQDSNNFLKRQVKRNRKLIANQQAEIQNLESQKQLILMMSSAVKRRETKSESSQDCATSSTSFETGPENLTPGLESSDTCQFMSWTFSEDERAAVTPRPESESLTTESSESKKTETEYSILRDRISQLEASLEAAVETGKTLERLLLMSQESMMKAVVSLCPKFHPDDEIPIHDEVALKLALSQFNSIVLNFAQEAKCLKQESKKTESGVKDRKIQELKKEVSCKDSQIEELQKRLMIAQEFQCKLLGKLGL